MQSSPCRFERRECMRKKHMMTTVALMLLTAALTYCITLYASEREYNAKLAGLSDREAEYAKIAEVRGYIDKYYVGEFDEKTINDGALYGMVAMLGDRWSYYLTAEQFASVVNSTNSKIVGIGVNASYDTDRQAVLVLDVYEDSPAEYAKIQPFDRIVSVDGEDVAKIGYDAAIKRITGTVGTAVSLTIEREGASFPINLSITRRELDVQSVKSKILDGNLGYVKISSFDANVDKDVASAIENLKKANVRGIIFDVRNNPGGLLQVMVNTLDPLLPEGIIIKEENKKGEATTHFSDANELNLPMAVLTNEYSISAAEFFAAALQETDKAEIVGEATTGKGLAQSQIQLKDGSGLILSVSKYFTGRGESLEDTGGIKPDIVVELTEEEEKNFYLLTEAQDRQLQAAITAVNERISKATQNPVSDEAE